MSPYVLLGSLWHVNAHLKPVRIWESDVSEPVLRVPQIGQQVCITFGGRNRVIYQNNRAMSQTRLDDFERWKGQGSPDCAILRIQNIR